MGHGTTLEAQSTGEAADAAGGMAANAAAAENQVSLAGVSRVLAGDGSAERAMHATPPGARAGQQQVGPLAAVRERACMRAALTGWVRAMGLARQAAATPRTHDERAHRRQPAAVASDSESAAAAARTAAASSKGSEAAAEGAKLLGSDMGEAARAHARSPTLESFLAAGRDSYSHHPTVNSQPEPENEPALAGAGTTAGGGDALRTDPELLGHAMGDIAFTIEELQLEGDQEIFEYFGSEFPDGTDHQLHRLMHVLGVRREEASHVEVSPSPWFQVGSATRKAGGGVVWGQTQRFLLLQTLVKRQLMVT